MRIKPNAILFLSSILFLTSSSGKTTTLQEAIEAFNKDKKLKLVLEEEKNVAAKECNQKESQLLNAIKEGLHLSPLADRIATEEKTTKKKKRVLKGLFTAKLLDDIDRGTNLVVVKSGVQKIDWGPYNNLSLKIKEMYPLLQIKEEESQSLLEEIEQKKQEYEEKKKDKETLDILIQRLTSLQALEKKNVLYTADKKEREKIIQGLELESSKIDLESLNTMILETNKRFLEIKTGILTLEQEISKLEKKLQTYKSEFDAFERNTKRLFMVLEDIHLIDECDFSSETSKTAFAKFNAAVTRLDGTLDPNDGDYIIVLQDKVISQELLSFFFEVYQDFENKVLALEENATFKRLTDVEKTHELAFEEDQLSLHLKRKNDVKGGNLTIKEDQELRECFSSVNKTLQKLTKTDFYGDAQEFFDYRLVFENGKLDIHSPAPFKIERLKKIHNFLIYHGKNMKDGLSGYAAEEELDTSQELTLFDFIEDDYFVDKDGQQMAGSIILSQQNLLNGKSKDLLASMVILEASSIGLRSTIQTFQHANDEDESDEEDSSNEMSNSKEGDSSDDEKSSWYILKLLGLQ